jgi:hypothetical protein
MNMTLPLNTMIDKWIDILSNSQKIKDFCNEKYGKDMKIFSGGNPNDPPKEECCPFLMILPGSKEEGISQSSFFYTVYICVVIQQPNVISDGETDTTGDYTESKFIQYSGISEISDLGQLIYEVLQKNLSQYPISDFTEDVLPGTMFPQFAANLTFVTEIEPSMGEEIIY